MKKIKFKKDKKISAICLIFLLIFSWVFSGWPQAWQWQDPTTPLVASARGDLVLAGNDTFRVDEKPEFRIRMSATMTAKMAIKRSLAGIFGFFGVQTASANELKALSIKGELFSLADRKTVAIQLATEIVGGEIQVTVPKSENQFKPGKYTLAVEMADGKKVLKGERDFSWGVLTINTNKSIFLPGEMAYLQITSLNEYGRASCTSKLELKIKNSESGIEKIFSTQSGTIQKSDTCGPNNVTDSPDYFAYLETGRPGIYQMRLTNLDTGYETTDSFEVREHVPFVLERVGATRINPFLSNYKMTLRVKANQDFNGTVTEKLPGDFKVINAGGGVAGNSSAGKEITWKVSLKNGQETTLKYEYKAPKISPQIFLLGRAELKQGSSVVFEEARQWHIGSDVIYNCAISLSAASNWQVSWGAACNNSWPGATGTADTASISFTGTTNRALTLIASLANALGAVTFNRPTGSKGLTLAMGAYNLSAASVALLGTTGGALYTYITISTGILTVTGNITSAGTDSKIACTGACTVNVGGVAGLLSGTLGTFTKGGTSTVNFNGSSGQTQTTAYIYDTVKINNTTGVTLGGVATITTLTIGDVAAGSIFNDGGFVITPGASSVLNLTNGTYNLGSATVGTSWPAWGTNNMTAGTVGYVSGVGTGQTVSATPAYKNVTFSGAAVKTVAAGGTLSVTGNFDTSGGTAAFATTANLTVTGNITNNGAITMGSGTITIGGNWTNSGTFTKGTSLVNYNTAAGGQTVGGLSYNSLTLSNNSGTADTAGGAITVGATFTTTAGGTLDMVTNALSVSTVSHSGILKTQNITATPVTTGITWGGTVTYDATTGGQTVRAGTYTTLTMGNTSGTQTADGNLGITTLNNNTNAADILNMGANSITSLTTSNNTGTIRTQSTSATALPTGITWGGTVTYDATTGGQTVRAGTYNNLTLSNTSLTDTASGALTVNGTLTTTGGGTLDMTAAYTLGGTLTTITNGGTISTAVPTSVSSAPLATGKTWTGGTVIYAGATAQTVMQGTYSGDLTFSGAGAKTTENGTITVGGNWDVSGGTATLNTNNTSMTVTGNITNSGGTGNITSGSGTISLQGNWTSTGTFTANTGTVTYAKTTGGQTVGGLTYNILTLSNSSNTDTAGGAITAATLNTTAGGILNMVTYDLSVTNVTNSGIIRTQSVSAAPLTAGKTWGGEVRYDAPSGIQTVASGSYNDLTATSSSARTLKFSTSAATNVTGTWTVTGSDSQLITLTSASTPTHWTINPTTASVSYVDVNYSDNTGTAFCATYSTSSNPLTNTNWSYNSGASCAVISITLDRSSFSYGTMNNNTASSTLTLWNGAGIIATNGTAVANFYIYGASTASWTLATATSTANIYAHRFCNKTDNDCTTPWTNYTPMTTSPTTLLKSGVLAGATVAFQLQMHTPNPSSVYTTQSAEVTVLATAP